MAVRQWMSRAFGLLGVVALATGCTDDGVSLFTICPIAPEISNNACTWDATSTKCVAEGVLNVAAGNPYRLNLKVESGLKPRSRDVPLLGETNGMQVTRAKIELTKATGETILFNWTDSTGMPRSLDNPYWVPATGYLDPGGSTIVLVSAIGTDYVARLAASTGLPEVVVNIKVHGQTNGQVNIESDSFAWPIRLTTASLIQANNQCSPIGYCPSVLGQDSFALACKDSMVTAN